MVKNLNVPHLPPRQAHFLSFPFLLLFNFVTQNPLLKAVCRFHPSRRYLCPRAPFLDKTRSMRNSRSGCCCRYCSYYWRRPAWRLFCSYATRVDCQVRSLAAGISFFLSFLLILSQLHLLGLLKRKKGRV